MPRFYPIWNLALVQKVPTYQHDGESQVDRTSKPDHSLLNVMVFVVLFVKGLERFGNIVVWHFNILHP